MGHLSTLERWGVDTSPLSIACTSHCQLCPDAVEGGFHRFGPSDFNGPRHDLFDRVAGSDIMLYDAYGLEVFLTLLESRLARPTLLGLTTVVPPRPSILGDVTAPVEAALTAAIERLDLAELDERLTTLSAFRAAAKGMRLGSLYVERIGLFLVESPDRAAEYAANLGLASKRALEALSSVDSARASLPAGEVYVRRGRPDWSRSAEGSYRESAELRTWSRTLRVHFGQSPNILKIPARWVPALGVPRHSVAAARSEPPGFFEAAEVLLTELPGTFASTLESARKI